MTDRLLKSSAILCCITVTLTCIAFTIMGAEFLKLRILAMPPPFIQGGMYGPGYPTTGRGWGPEQATGEPDTKLPGDQVTAWASYSTDTQDEWLQLTYKDPVLATAVLVYETYNPGAVTKVTAVDGENETILWEGKDPVVIDKDGRGIADIAVTPDMPVKTIKIYLASKAIFGWNEIDAVGLGDADGNIHWAETATASSTFAEPPPMGTMPGDPYFDRLNDVEKRVEALEKK